VEEIEESKREQVGHNVLQRVGIYRGDGCVSLSLSLDFFLRLGEWRGEESGECGEEKRREKRPTGALNSWCCCRKGERAEKSRCTL